MPDINQKDFLPMSRHGIDGKKGPGWQPHSVRLTLSRRALFDEGANEFARRLNISAQRVSNTENGFRLSIDVANRIRLAAPGITLDWLYHGVERAVPMDMVTRLRRKPGRGAPASAR